MQKNGGKKQWMGIGIFINLFILCEHSTASQGGSEKKKKKKNSTKQALSQIVI